MTSAMANSGQKEGMGAGDELTAAARTKTGSAAPSPTTWTHTDNDPKQQISLNEPGRATDRHHR